MRSCATLADVANLIPNKKTISVNDLSLPNSVSICNINEFIRLFLDRNPYTGCQLDPDLLIRHASGILYQEAHLELEKRVHQRELFPAYVKGKRPPGVPKRDARFTPPELACALVQQAFMALWSQTGASKAAPLVVLDPAVGSGVFLRETLWEAGQGAYSGKLHVRGMDNSGIACAISSFYLGGSHFG